MPEPDLFDDERALRLRGGLGPWPAEVALRLPGEEVVLEARPLAWVPPRVTTVVIAALLVAPPFLLGSPWGGSALLALALAAETARSAWRRRTRYVLTTARVLVLRGLLRSRVAAEASRSRMRLDGQRARLEAPGVTIPLVGLDEAQLAALAEALDAPRIARGVERARLRRSDVALA